MTALAPRAEPLISAPPLEPLISAPPPRVPARGGLSDPLRARYGSDLWIPLRAGRPTVVVNFVSTLDGVVSYATPEAAGGGEISGFFEPDRFIMGLLRAMADAVLIGAGTMRAGHDEAWTPESAHPDSADRFASLRRALGLRPHPLTVVVSGSGAIDLSHPGMADPDVNVLIITTDAGAAALRSQQPRPHIEVRSLGSEVTAAGVMTALGERGLHLVLCEGGPHLLGMLLAARAVEELFLTIAPQVAGRSDLAPRLALVEDAAFASSDAPWGELVDLRRSGNHLFTRYRF